MKYERTDQMHQIRKKEAESSYPLMIIQAAPEGLQSPHEELNLQMFGNRSLEKGTKREEETGSRLNGRKGFITVTSCAKMNPLLRSFC